MLRAILGCAVTATVVLLLRPECAAADEVQVVRGKYLVEIASCHDCHTPGYFLGKPDFKRYLGGSDVGIEVPGVGVFAGPNLTPDPETGLGRWTSKQIATALSTGIRPDGRVLSPVMPWPKFAGMTPADMDAVVAFLKSLPPVANKVPGPFGANQEPSIFVMKIIPPKAAQKNTAQ